MAESKTKKTKKKVSNETVYHESMDYLNPPKDYKRVTLKVDKKKADSYFKNKK